MRRKVRQQPVVLVVDDHVDTAKSFRVLLEEFGFEVFACMTAEAALAVLRHPTTSVDAVLCDLQLNRGSMSGFELRQAMSDEADLEDVPIIAVTGYGAREDRERTAAAGFSAHLVKPVAVDQLLATLRDVLCSTRRLPPVRATRGRSASRRTA